MSDPRDAPSAAPPAPASGGERFEWLFSLRVGGCRYAFDAGLVVEVVRLGPLTRLPAAPPFLPGVFFHRGEVLPVLDLAHLLGQPVAVRGQGTRAAVIRSGAWRLAVVADALEGLTALPREGLEPPPAEGGAAASFLTAVCPDPHGPLGIVDLPALIESARTRSLAP